MDGRHVPAIHVFGKLNWQRENCQKGRASLLESLPAAEGMPDSSLRRLRVGGRVACRPSCEITVARPANSQGKKQKNAPRREGRRGAKRRAGLGGKLARRTHSTRVAQNCSASESLFLKLLRPAKRSRESRDSHQENGIRSLASRTPSPPAGSPTPASATSATTAPARGDRISSRQSSATSAFSRP